MYLINCETYMTHMYRKLPKSRHIHRRCLVTCKHICVRMCKSMYTENHIRVCVCKWQKALISKSFSLFFYWKLIDRSNKRPTRNKNCQPCKKWKSWLWQAICFNLWWKLKYENKTKNQGWRSIKPERVKNVYLRLEACYGKYNIMQICMYVSGSMYLWCVCVCV